ATESETSEALSRTRFMMRSSASLTKSRTSLDAPEVSRRALPPSRRRRFSRSLIKSSIAAISSAAADLARVGIELSRGVLVTLLQRKTWQHDEMFPWVQSGGGRRVRCGRVQRFGPARRSNCCVGEDFADKTVDGCSFAKFALNPLRVWAAQDECYW